MPRVSMRHLITVPHLPSSIAGIKMRGYRRLNHAGTCGGCEICRHGSGPVAPLCYISFQVPVNSPSGRYLEGAARSCVDAKGLTRFGQDVPAARASRWKRSRLGYIAMVPLVSRVGLWVYGVANETPLAAVLYQAASCRSRLFQCSIMIRLPPRISPVTIL